MGLFLTCLEGVLRLDPSRFPGREIFVLNVTSNEIQPDWCPDGHFLRVPIDDTPRHQIYPFLDQTSRFIREHLDAGHIVVVHCHAGISRSASIVIAYLLYARICTTFLEANQFVKERRRRICPNFGFCGELERYSNELAAARALAPQDLLTQ